MEAFTLNWTISESTSKLFQFVLNEQLINGLSRIQLSASISRLIGKVICDRRTSSSWSFSWYTHSWIVCWPTVTPAGKRSCCSKITLLHSDSGGATNDSVASSPISNCSCNNSRDLGIPSPSISTRIWPTRTPQRSACESLISWLTMILLPSWTNWQPKSVLEHVIDTSSWGYASSSGMIVTETGRRNIVDPIFAVIYTPCKLVGSKGICLSSCIIRQKDIFISKSSVASSPSIADNWSTDRDDTLIDREEVDEWVRYTPVWEARESERSLSWLRPKVFST